MYFVDRYPCSSSKTTTSSAHGHIDPDRSREQFGQVPARPEDDQELVDSIGIIVSQLSRNGSIIKMTPPSPTRQLPTFAIRLTTSSWFADRLGRPVRTITRHSDGEVTLLLEHLHRRRELTSSKSGRVPKRSRGCRVGVELLLVEVPLVDMHRHRLDHALGGIGREGLRITDDRLNVSLMSVRSCQVLLHHGMHRQPAHSVPTTRPSNSSQSRCRRRDHMEVEVRPLAAKICASAPREREDRRNGADSPTSYSPAAVARKAAMPIRNERARSRRSLILAVCPGSMACEFVIWMEFTADRSPMAISSSISRSPAAVQIAREGRRHRSSVAVASSSPSPAARSNEAEREPDRGPEHSSSHAPPPSSPLTQSRASSRIGPMLHMDIGS